MGSIGQRPVVAGAEDATIVTEEDAADLKSSTSRQRRDGDGDGHEGVVFEGEARSGHAIRLRHRSCRCHYTSDSSSPSRDNQRSMDHRMLGTSLARLS